MQPQHQTAPNTNPGTSSNGIKPPEAKENESPIPTDKELARFYDSLNGARASAEPNSLPGIETSRKIITHFMRGNMAGFDRVHYFIYQGVKVFEQGKRAEAERKERLTEDQILHGDKS